MISSSENLLVTPKLLFPPRLYELFRSFALSDRITELTRNTSNIYITARIVPNETLPLFYIISELRLVSFLMLIPL